MSDLLVIEDLAQPNPAALPDLCALYEAAFDIAERVPFENLCRRVTHPPPRGGQYHLWEARVAGVLVGMAAFAFLKHEGWVYLTQIAVAEPMRGRGYGRALFKSVAQVCQSLTTPPQVAHGLFWEVALPEDAHDEAERAQRAGVIAYYQHCGARLTALRYLCPPMIAGVTPEVNYYLMLWSSVWTETNLPYPLARNLILAGLSENGAPIGSNAVWEALRHARELYARTLAVAS